jgi:hypothetical protein
MSSVAMSLEDFLGHSTGGGGGGSRLKNWKNGDPPRINVLLHTQAKIVTVWRHGLNEVREVTDKETGETSLQVWGSRWNCLEDERVLKSQYRRDKATNQRRVPPVICPLCIMVEVLIRMYRDGSLGFCEQILKFEGDKAEDTRIITAGGFVNQYGSKYLSSEQKGAMRKAGVKLTEAWKENALARCSYIFRVVDVENPGDGVQVAVETAQLGDEVKRVIRDKIQEFGDEEGHPLLNPYVIRWQYSEAAPLKDKYTAQSMSRMTISETARQLITDGPPPDIDYLTKDPDIALLRALLEQHALVELPWDEIFGPAERAAEKEDPRPDPAQTESRRASKPAVKKPAPAQSKSARKPEPEPQNATEAQQPAEQPELFECDACGKEVLGADDTVCPACGAKYDPATGALLPAEKPKPKGGRKRSQAAAKSAETPPAAEQSASDGEGGSGWATEPTGSDGIPF